MKDSFHRTFYSPEAAVKWGQGHSEEANKNKLAHTQNKTKNTCIELVILGRIFLNILLRLEGGMKNL